MSTRTVVCIVLSAALLLAFGVAPTPTPAAPSAAPAPLFHCQVPCGIYGDSMRVEALREDAATVSKAMAQLEAGDLNMNQTVRWVMTKDEHAQKIQDQVAQYWLAQRIKVPAADADAAAQATYTRQLGLLHRLIVSAMKCKQTTDEAHVTSLLATLDTFAATYFDADALKHLQEHR